MDIKINKIEVDERSINPTLLIDVSLIFMDKIEVPISVNGNVFLQGGKVLGSFNEFQIHSDYSLGLRLLDRQTRQHYLSSGNKFHDYYNTQISLQLNEKSIDHIEQIREKQFEKSVRLLFSFFVKILEIKAEPNQTGNVPPNEDTISLVIKRIHHEFEIKQSDWINKFSKGLGIGNFLLLELNIPINGKVKTLWKELFSRLELNLKEMENSIRSGDWQKTLFYARKYFENIKVADNKPSHKLLNNNLKESFIKDQHSDEGYKDFQDAIWKLFEFTSKFVHDKDKKGEINPIPIPHKEDAYFTYCLCLGLHNLIGKKISNN